MTSPAQPITAVRPPDGPRDFEAPAPRLGIVGTTLGAPASPPTHRRRTRWFELNPGCFGRAVLWAASAAAGATVLGGIGLWAAWRMRRAFAAVRVGRTAWRGYRRVRRVLRRR